MMHQHLVQPLMQHDTATLLDGQTLEEPVAVPHVGAVGASGRNRIVIHDFRYTHEQDASIEAGLLVAHQIDSDLLHLTLECGIAGKRDGGVGCDLHG